MLLIAQVSTPEILMSRKEKIPLKPAVKSGGQPDDQIINDLMAKRKLQQDALKKIITSMDKSSEDGSDTNPSAPAKTAGSKEHKQDRTKLI